MAEEKTTHLSAPEALARPRTVTPHIPGPSPNAATNLLFADVVLRGVGTLSRRMVERAMLGARYDREKAREIVAGKTLGYNLTSYAVARLATRSLPGLAAAGVLVLGKALLDRGMARSEAEAKGHRQLMDLADNADGEDDPQSA